MKPQQDERAWDLLIHLKERQIEINDAFTGQSTRTYVAVLPTDMAELTGLEQIIFCKKDPTDIEPRTIYLVSDTGKLWRSHGPLSESEARLFEIYLPYIFLTGEARSTRRCRLVSHFAVSLDGRIATESGHSKWIGCIENRIHAHRMRSLCDGILVGRFTFERDTPQLTVREVKGTNPTRIILGNVNEVIGMDPEEAPVIVARTLNGHTPPAIETPGVQEVTGKDIDEILTKLCDMGIHTVYLEGGSRTSSSLLESGHIDILQMHYAPILMGSGISAWQTKSINEVTQALTFTDYNYQNIGDGLMFTGWPDYEGRQNGLYRR